MIIWLIIVILIEILYFITPTLFILMIIWLVILFLMLIWLIFLILMMIFYLQILILIPLQIIYLLWILRVFCLLVLIIFLPTPSQVLILLLLDLKPNPLEKSGQYFYSIIDDPSQCLLEEILNFSIVSRKIPIEDIFCSLQYNLKDILDNLKEIIR